MKIIKSVLTVFMFFVAILLIPVFWVAIELLWQKKES